MQNQTIYIVTSLPRTGTTSLCEMANICNLKSVHVLRNFSLYNHIEKGYNFFADTPFYIPEFLIGVLESLPNINFKFIYSHKNIESLITSLQKLKNKWNPLTKPIDSKNRMFDHIAYTKLNSYEYLVKHFLSIQNISKFYEIPLLEYNFSSGWGHFCEFIDSPIPNVQIPHLNQNP